MTSSESIDADVVVRRKQTIFDVSVVVSIVVLFGMVEGNIDVIQIQVVHVPRQQSLQLVSDTCERWAVSRIFTPTLRYDVVPGLLSAQVTLRNSNL